MYKRDHSFDPRLDTEGMVQLAYQAALSGVEGADRLRHRGTFGQNAGADDPKQTYGICALLNGDIALWITYSKEQARRGEFTAVAESDVIPEVELARALGLLPTCDPLPK